MKQHYRILQVGIGNRIAAPRLRRSQSWQHWLRQLKQQLLKRNGRRIYSR
jgi:hypothetical protein